MVRLSDVNLTLSDVDLGGFDAEQDHQLTKHFITTPLIGRLLNKRKYLVLGRKGSGKSALFRELPRIAREHDDSIVISLTPDAYAWSALRQYKEQGLSSEHAHANAWKLTIAVEVAACLTEASTEWPNELFEHATVLSRFIRANFDTGVDLRSVAQTVYKGVESFDLTALGFAIGVTRGKVEALPSPVTPAVTDALFNHIRALLSHVRLLIQLDRLDDEWQGLDDDKSLIAGLLKATKDINDEFASNELNSKIIVYLRSDIYDALSFDDSDKHRQGEERIHWDADTLRALVNARLPAKVTVDELLQDAPMRGRTVPYDYMLRRTFYRPREVLQYLQLALEAAGSDETQIWTEDIKSSESQFSEWKVRDLKREYAKAVPEFPELIDALQQATTPLDSTEELEELLTKRAPSIVEKRTARWCSKELWNASAIGARLNNTGQVRFKSTDPNFSMPAEGSVYIHHGLMVGLNVKERRKKGADDVSDD